MTDSDAAADTASAAGDVNDPSQAVTDEPTAADDGPGLLDRIPAYTVPAILLGVPLLLWLLTLVAPTTFYDNFVWKYYWGPLKADAASGALAHNGVIAEPGYNLVNTGTWALLLGTCLIGLTQMVNAVKVRVGTRFILGATAWVVTGAVWHVLEDTELVIPPLQYIFITPPIYLLYAAFAIVALWTGIYARRVADNRTIDHGLQKIWLILSLGVLLYVLAWISDWDQVIRYLDPVHVAIFAALTYFVIRLRVMRVGGIDPTDVMLIMSLMPMLMALDYVWLFTNDPWHPSSDGLPSAFWVAPGLAFLTVMLVRAAPAKGIHGFLVGGGAVLAGFAAFLIANRLFDTLGFDLPGFVLLLISAAAAAYAFVKFVPDFTSNASEFATALRHPLNLMLVFSQLVDGFATSLGLDLAGYSEKHVLSGFLIDSFRDLADSIGWAWGAAHPTFLAFVPVKLLISLGVVYAIDVYSKEDAARSPTMIGFVKFAIIMVGIGPGVRNFTRLALGV